MFPIESNGKKNKYKYSSQMNMNKTVHTVNSENEFIKAAELKI